MKKLFSSLLVILLVLGVLSGCGGTASSGKTSSVTSSGAAPSAASSAAGKDTSSAAGSSVSSVDTSSDASGTEKPASLSDVVILYTNDVHCGVDDKIGYAGLSAYRKELEAAGKKVLLVDCGDAIQGTEIGMMTKGKAIVQLMNAMNYDFAALGNHEFDYSVDNLREIAKEAKYTYVCCNVKDKISGRLLFDPYKIIEAGGKKIAFVGVVTPRTLMSSMPAYFENEEGEFIYDFSIGDDGKKLYETVQKTVDEARAEGAEICILLSHLGVDATDAPYRSTDLIAGTTGIDVVLDAHSHSVIPSEQVKNKDGKNVLYSQTGTKLANIGKLTFDEKGGMACELIPEYDKKDETITKLIEKLREEFDEILKEHVGNSKYDLAISDEEGNRIVRNAETNLADLVADAYRYAADSEVAILGGGNVRADVKAGELTKREVLAVLPHGNTIVLVEVTGQKLADALEFGAHEEPEENGGFVQVSGIEYTLDMSIPSGVTMDENGKLTGIEGERRVKDIRINGEPLDPERVYTVGGPDYFLVMCGGGFTMFEGCERISINPVTDCEAMISYIKDVCGGEIPEKYANRYGEGRITLINGEEK